MQFRNADFKSGIKAKQYLNNGVPVLSTKLPENSSVIVDGKNGYYCETSGDFEKRITEFHNMDDETYSSFIENARNSMINFNHDKYFKDFLEIKNIQN